MSWKRGVQELAEGKLLSPILRVELSKPRWHKFSVEVEWTERPYDGWFHPSTQADWPARKLALYLTSPDLIEEEETTFEKVIAVTQGHFFHHLAGEVFTRNGIVSELEIPGEDPEHNRKGHMDGRLKNGRGYEFKTINQQYLQKKLDGAQTLMQFKPGYYAQAQDYMDMHDLQEMQYLIMGVWYPYPMAEFIVPRDEVYMARQRAKYRQAIEMAEKGALPDACCAVRSTEAKACELRLACPIGRMAASA